MQDSKKTERANGKLILSIIGDLLEVGVTPRSVAIEADGSIKIEVASYQRPSADVEATPRKPHGHMARLAERMAARTAKAGNN